MKLKTQFFCEADGEKMATKKVSAKFVTLCLEIIENIGLIVILFATVIAAYNEVDTMMGLQEVSLGDLLLLFLYLEVLAMVGWYYRKGKLPVRFPLYIAIIALARYIILDIKEMDELRLLGVTAGILLLSAAVLVIRYGHIKYPYHDTDKDGYS